jgi:hypothetical protein
MTHLEWWKLGADILLLGALVWLSFHLTRSRQTVAVPSRQGLDLERTLRGLIKEADLASSSLQDQLLRRQQSLEKVLRELEATEQRVTRAVQSAETRVATSGVAASGPSVAARSQPRDFGMPEAPSFNAVGPRSQPPVTPPSARPQTNIYGEIVAPSEAQRAESAPPPAKSTPLAAAIEREVVPSQRSAAAAARSARSAPAESLSEVRRAAEELLRAGKDLEFVARRTNLSIDEVRLISNGVGRSTAVREGKAVVPSPIVEDPAAVAAAVATPDPRLGVLSPIRRSIETI